MVGAGLALNAEANKAVLFVLMLLIVIDERGWAQKSEAKNAENRTPKIERPTPNAEYSTLN
jgi:hypothetical protein